ncbi:ABC transporter permease OS=Lysinibacillus sphaericus OX=1421 GN=LS41612_15115 PE=4 SV=1 [Lysinibacillus sphaericus]
MNIFIHELKTYRKSTIIWSLSLIAIMIIFMSMYSTFCRRCKGFYENR